VVNLDFELRVGVEQADGDDAKDGEADIGNASGVVGVCDDNVAVAGMAGALGCGVFCVI
jgi:hypothetical protein